MRTRCVAPAIPACALANHAAHSGPTSAAMLARRPPALLLGGPGGSSRGRSSVSRRGGNRKRSGTSHERLADGVLTAYSYAFEMLYGQPPREIRLVNFVRTKMPKIETPTTERGRSDHERLFHLANDVVKGTRAGVFIPNRGCWMCHDCEYDRDCREWTGNEQ